MPEAQYPTRRQRIVRYLTTPVEVIYEIHLTVDECDARLNAWLKYRWEWFQQSLTAFSGSYERDEETIKFRILVNRDFFPRVSGTTIELTGSISKQAGRSKSHVIGIHRINPGYFRTAMTFASLSAISLIWLLHASISTLRAETGILILLGVLIFSFVFMHIFRRDLIKHDRDKLLKELADRLELQMLEE